MSDHHDRPNDDKDEPFEGRTYLYIRDHPSDTGAEPLASGLAFWISPDITIIKPDGTRGTEAVAAQPNQVEIYVNNAGGIDAVDAYVDAFHADPSTAFNPMTADVIGGGPLTIPGYTRQQITLPWTPPTSAAGHRCLLARVSLIIPPDTYLDGTIFDVPGDRHVSQRNLHVISLAESAEMEFAFKIVNPSKRTATFALHATEIRNEREFEGLRATLGCGSLRMGATPLRSITLRAGDRSIDAAPREQPRLRDVRRRDIDTPLVAAARLRSRGLEVKLEGASEQDAMLSVQRNRETTPGDMHAIQITQFDDEGVVRGGLTVLVQH